MCHCIDFLCTLITLSQKIIIERKGYIAMK